VGELARQVAAWARRLSRPVTFMEVCGTHTNAIAAAGLRRLLPPQVRLISGPGCPVCVTPVGYVDQAIALAQQPENLVATFGDLLRVPASVGSLEQARALGCDVRVVYSPRDAVQLAAANPQRRVIFLGVGFETTVPTVAAALWEALQQGVDNFFLLSGHKLIPPALAALLADPVVRLDGLILPGHVSVIIGARAYRPVLAQYPVPAAITGFTPVDVLRSVVELVQQVVDGRAELVNLYGRVVREEGNPAAWRFVEQTFVPCDARWRGLGEIPLSGLALRPELAARDAGHFPVALPEPREPVGCRCGDVLRGLLDPPQCPLFATACTPDTAVGACMVSAEGACAAWYRHERGVGAA
ncbi:MAG: hydrogenase formation protein HypD, partial [Thermoanaerobaculum sp.]|nr:hydrogenase formation protein HypD [Thermoanaerobaculum sp.]